MTTTRRHRRERLLFLPLLAVAGCLGSLDSPPLASAGTPDASGMSTESDFDRAMMQIASSYQTFPQINSAPYMSSLGTFQINLYVQGDVRDYWSIHPDTTPSKPVSIEVGTVIVREVLDAQGATSKLTVMAKGPSGYDPTLGDWWFGEADPQGQPLVENGAVRLGRLDDCHGCHIPRATSDYLFGVPQADQGWP